MIGTGIDVRVKVQDIVAAQLPEFIRNEAPLTDNFLRQFYVSQEFQGGPVDFASNLDQYLKLSNLTPETIAGEYFLEQNLDLVDDVVFINTTKSFPQEWGLLKINDEILTYTGVTTNSFTGVVRGFSGVTSFRSADNPNELVFEETIAAPHTAGTKVQNLSSMFLKEFYKKIKFTFAPGLENIEFDADVDAGNWIRNARSFYQTKGSEESIEILFKVLFGEDPTVIDLENYLIKSSTALYSRRDFAVGVPVSGNPVNLKGKTIFQSNDTSVFGAISEIEPFIRDGDLYYRLYLFVSNDEISNERKLFTVPGRTKAQRAWKDGDTTVTVDTTIGFRDNNEFITEDGTVFTYVERTVNQFLGVTCTDPTKTIAIDDSIIDDITVYGTDANGEKITLRLTGTCADISFENGVPFTSVGEKIRVDVLGQNITNNADSRETASYSDIVANSLIYNTSVRFQVTGISGATFSIAASFLDASQINQGDKVDILIRGSQEVALADRTVTAVDFLNATVTIDDTFGIPENREIDIRRKQNFASSNRSPIDYGNDAVLSNVINLYDATGYDDNYYVATNSLPSYTMEVEITESSILGIATNNFTNFDKFEGEFTTLVFDNPVPFFTGDLITYSGIGTMIVPICEFGEYFVEVLNDPRQIRLYLSPSFIGSDKVVGFNGEQSIGIHVFTLENQSSRSIKSQRTYRKIPISSTNGKQNITINRTPVETETGTIAILTNGVEVISYKGADRVFLGPLVDIDPVSGGRGYSVTQPQEMVVADADLQLINDNGFAGSTAYGTPVIKGKLEKILIDPQDFDVDKVFSISVLGGNSSGASAIPQIERRRREVIFDSRTVTLGGGIDPNDETILFEQEHKFGLGEQIVYNNRNGESIGIASAGGTNNSVGAVLADGGIYFCQPVNNKTIKIYPTLGDLENNTNNIGFTSNRNGYGIQSFDTLSKSRIVGATIIEDGGDFYYRNMMFRPENVFIEYDEIRYPNHGFDTGEIVEYGTTGTPVGGLSTALSYYVNKIDDNKLQLAAAGIGGTDQTDYLREDWVRMTSTGTGTHNIKYPEIFVEVAVSFASTVVGVITATPFVRGEIDQVYVNEGGYYGSDIINFQKNPKVSIKTGRGARLRPVIIDGRITGVQLFSRGRDYPDNPDVFLEDSTGAGQGAVLRADVVDGEIKDIIIVAPGIDYGQETTRLIVADPAMDAILTPRIRPLTVNLDARFGWESLVDNSYSVVSYERTIREGVYKDFGFTHSPIVGWANDGNPIYGGFGLSDPSDFNSGFRAMKTAYEAMPQEVYGRPSDITYPSGFFVEDYVYTDNGDLDEYNGRYCRTPEFPNGVYAYFAGISTDTQSLAKVPQFPYFIGPKFRDAPVRDSSADVNQDFELGDKPIYRNTFPYAVGNPFFGSEFLDQSYLFDTQDSIVEAIQEGSVNRIEVIGAGVSYSIGDIPRFDNTEDTVSSVVSELTGKFVKTIKEESLGYVKEQVRIIRKDKNTIRTYIEPFHDYLNKDNVIFTGLATNLAPLNGPQQISVDNQYMTLFSPMEALVFPGYTDIFVNSITDNVSVGSSIIVGLGQSAEGAEVLNIFPVNKALRIRRPLGLGASLPIGTPVNVYNNYFDVKLSTDDIDSTIDYIYFFNPTNTIGVGTFGNFGNSVLVEYNIGSIQYNIDVPVGSIFAPDHGFVGVEPIIVEKSPNDFPISIFDGENIYNLPRAGVNTSEAFVVRLSNDYIGIRTSANGVNVAFTAVGDDSPLYSFKSVRRVERGNVERIDAVVTTEVPHELKNNDIITMNVTADGVAGVGTNKEVKVSFDEISQTLLVDPREFDSVGVDTESNLINIPRHNFTFGDRVIYTNYAESESIVGIVTHEKYYVVPFDQNRIQLAETFEDIKPGQELLVNFTSSGVGTQFLTRVNPELDITANNDALFDLSDPSLLDYDLQFFYDQTLTEVFDTNGIDDRFTVVGFGTAGLEDAYKIIRYSENNPSTIYYGLEKGGYISTADTLSINHSTITLVPSKYNAASRIINVGLTTFKYSLAEKPESDSYSSVNDLISYTTKSRNALGGVAEVKIISTGANYQNIPEYITVESEFGNGATLRASSSNISLLSSYRIQNPGWAYSADNTLRPTGIVQPKIEFGDSDFVTSIDILDGGIGYQNPPNAVLIDAVTRQPIDNGSIELFTQSSGISEVKVDVAPSGLAKNNHELFTTNNSNGIPILQIGRVDNVVGVVTFIIQTPILGYSQPPFEVGDRVFVENIISEFGERANMNSEDYGYKFFDVVRTEQTNPIRIAVQYPEEARGNIGIAVTFQGAFSSIVNKNIYPEFRVNQSTAIFIVGERLAILDDLGELIETDLVVEESNTNFFKVKGNFDVLPGDVLKGGISGVIVTITGVENSTVRFEIDSVSRITNGWNDQVGFLNEELQVTPNNDYYQNLSYSIKSTRYFDEVIGPVNRLVHPSGLKNFVDVKLESSAAIGATSQTATSITLDFVGLTDKEETPLRVDRVNSFDLGYDQDVNNNRTNSIRFNSRTPNKRLTDYIEVKTNRVLLHDDISNDFIDEDNVRAQKEYIDFNVISSVYTRGMVFVRNPFTDQAELIETINITVNNNAFTMQKAVISDNFAGYGEFNAVSQNSTEYSLRYKPFNGETFDFDAKLFTNIFTFGDDSNVDIGYVELDGVDTSVNAGRGVDIFFGTEDDADAAIIHATITNERSETSYYEFYVFRIGNDTYSATYGFTGDTFINFNSDFVGRFEAGIDSDDDVMTVTYFNDTDQRLLVTTKSIEYKTIDTGVNPYRFKRNSIPSGTERSLILQSERVVGAKTDPFIVFGRYDVTLFQAIRSVVYLSAGDFGAIHQVMFLNSDGSTYTNEYPFLTDGPGTVDGIGVGTFGSIIDGEDMLLVFYPDPGLTPGSLRITSYDEAFYRELDSINYRNIPLVYGESEETYYIDRFIAPLGQRTNNVRFPLTYEGIPIYEKVINPQTQIIDTGVTGFNVFNVKEHFFSTGEELYYRPGSSVEAVQAEPIRIAPTVIPGSGGITTTIMPSTVYAIKRDLNRFSVAMGRDEAINLTEIQIVGFGSGNSHRFGMEEKLAKTIITIDGVLQSPIASSNVTFQLVNPIDFEQNLLVTNGIGTVRVGDLLLVGNEEYVRIDNVGFATSVDGPINNTGGVPLLDVKRGVIGSAATSHLAGSPMDLYRGSYNIVESDVVFTEAPSGKGALSVNNSNLVEINSLYQGRTFLQREYDRITVFDDISDQFNGDKFDFVLTSAGSTVKEVENGSGVLLINDIYQTPTTDNNEGNNYFYSYNPQVGINSVIFTGVTSANGNRAISEFDVNQNQIPRGGLIVSLGSTPGLGYAPLYGASLEAEVSGGIIQSVLTTNTIGVTTAVRYADYDNETGEMSITAIGASATAEIAIADAQYQNISGSLIITSPVPLADLGIVRSDIIVIKDLEFDCAGFSTSALEVLDAPYDNISGIVTIFTLDPHGSNIGDRVALNDLEYSCVTSGVTTTIFPDGTNGYEFFITDILSDTAIAVNVGPSTIAHTYVGQGTCYVGITTTTFPDQDDTYQIVSILDANRFSLDVGAILEIPHFYLGGGTFQKFEPFQLISDGTNPEFVYLDRLEFSCPSPGGGGYGRELIISDAPYDETTGIVTVRTTTRHKRVPGNPIELRDLTYECDGTSLTTLNVTNVLYGDTTGFATVTFDASHGSDIGDRVQLSGIGFTCGETSLLTLGVIDAPYDNTTGIVTVTFAIDHGTVPGARVQLTGLGYTCNDAVSLTELGIVTASYNNSTGDVDFVLDGPHGLTVGDMTRVVDTRWQCDSFGNLASNIFPRPNVEGLDHEAIVVGSTTSFTINVGSNVFVHEYLRDGSVFVGFTTTLYPDGTQGYEFEVLSTPDSQSITIGVGTLAFPQEYVSGGVGTVGFTTTVFPDGTFGYEFDVVDVVSLNTLVLDVGAAPGIAHTYVSGGIGTVGFTTTVFPDGTNGFSFPILSTPDAFTVEVNVGAIPGITHDYVSGGRMKVGLNTDFFPDRGEAFPFIFRDDRAHFRVLVGSSEFTHTYVGGGEVGQYNKNNPGSGYNLPSVAIGITEEGHVGAAASIIAYPGPGGELTNIVVLDGGSGYTDPYIWAPDPNYANLPVKGFFRRSTGFSTETGKNLFINCEVGAATTTAIGRSEYFSVNNYEISNQGYAFLPGDVVEVVGLVTDKSLSQPIEPFQLTVLEIFTDNFSAWNFGELDYIDSIAGLQDGVRTRFPLVYKGESFSFEKNPSDEESAAIDLDSILLIYVNTVLQVPGLNYLFDGGTSFTFTRAPFAEDDIDIYFYRGKRNLDSRIVVEVDESLRPGDELQLKKNDALLDTETQFIRTVTEIASSDSVRTNLYFGSNDLETEKPRETAWDKQKRDIFIYGEIAPKTRDSLEAIIKPRASIIRNFLDTDTDMFVDSAKLFEYEKFTYPPTVLTNLEARVNLVPDVIVPAKLEAVVNEFGGVSSVNVIEPGSGYPPAGTGVRVTIAAPPGVSAPADDPRRAQLFIVFIGGSIVPGGVSVINPGQGYLQSSPPLISITNPPVPFEDLLDLPIIQGFAGIITGIQRTSGSTPAIGNGIRFYYKVDAGIDLNQLVPGYSLVVSNTSVGNGVISVGDIVSDRVGVGTQFLDCVYQIYDNQPLSRIGYFDTNVIGNPGIGINTSGDNLGYFSWGKFSNIVRDIDLSLDLNTIDGSTYDPNMLEYPLVQRTSEGLRNEGGLSKKK